jgi:drug/metabolite transporter (DMT)-like permease
MCNAAACIFKLNLPVKFIPLKKAWVPWLILTSLAVIWGSSFILIKRGLLYLDALELGSLRIFIAFLFLLPFAVTKLSRITARQYLWLAFVGIIGSGIPSILFAVAQRGIDSSMAGILNSFTPFFTMSVGLGLGKLKVKWFNVAGLFIGLAGTLGLLSVGGGKSLSFNMGYAVYIFAATLCYAFNVNIIKYFLKEVPPVTITAVSFFLTGLPFLLFILLFTGLPGKIAAGYDIWPGVLYVALLAVVGTGVALMIFNALIKTSSPVFASSVTYLIPVVALIWGVFDGEHFSAVYFLWIALVLAGVFLVNRQTLRIEKKKI